MSDLAEVGDFCPNDSCPDAGKTDSGNIIKYGRTAKGLQRYRCKTCGKTFSENTGTIFYNKHAPAKEIIETLALVAEGSRVSSLSRVKGYKEETIRNWLQQAAEHVERVEEVLMQEYEIDRGQLDGLWSYVGHKDREEQGKEGKKEPSDDAKGIYWRSTMVETDTRLCVGRGIGKTETEASEEVFRTLKRALCHPDKPPPTVSDGGGGIRKAMVQVWGEVPDYKGRGRPPEKKRPQDGWEYLQVIKERDESDRTAGTRKEVVFGEEEEVLELFEDHTAYVERTHLTMRQMNGRLIRKGLGFSKVLQMHRAAAGWEDAIYNLTRPHKSLRIDMTGPWENDLESDGRNARPQWRLGSPIRCGRSKSWSGPSRPPTRNRSTTFCRRRPKKRST